MGCVYDESVELPAVQRVNPDVRDGSRASASRWDKGSDGAEGLSMGSRPQQLTEHGMDVPRHRSLMDSGKSSMASSGNSLSVSFRDAAIAGFGGASASSSRCLLGR